MHAIQLTTPLYGFTHLALGALHLRRKTGLSVQFTYGSVVDGTFNSQGAAPLTLSDESLKVSLQAKLLDEGVTALLEAVAAGDEFPGTVVTLP